MAIGRSKVNEANLARVQLEKTATGEELAVCRFNGTQRDVYVKLMLELRDHTEKNGISVTALSKENMTKLPGEVVALFTRLEYRLVWLSVMDGDAFAEGRVEPLFASPEEVAGVLEPSVLNDWVSICNRVNGLGDKEERQIAADFTQTPN